MRKLSLLILLPAILLLAGCSKQVILTEETPKEFDVCLLNWQLSDCSQSWSVVTQHCNENSCVSVAPIPTVEEVLAPEILAIAEWTTSGNMVYASGIWVERAPTTGGISMEFPRQPTKFPEPHTYSSNTQYLINRELKNSVSLDIPSDAKDVTITFKLAKAAKADNVPGNIRLSVDNKIFANGRLDVDKSSYGNSYAPEYQYDLNHITTQDHPKGIDLSSAIGNILKIQGFIGESNNFIEKISLEWKL